MAASSALHLGAWLFFARAALWQTLSRDARHPVATHLRRQFSRSPRVPLLRTSMAYGCALLVAVAYAFSAVEHAMVWLLPIWLMLFSSFYCALWIARIVPLLSRQSILGVLDEISLIPPGPVFIYLTICKVVINWDDAVAWLALLRRVLAVMVLLVLLMSFCIAATLLAESSAVQIASILVDLALTAAVIWLEHSQSTVLACLIAIEVAARAGRRAERTSVAIAAFALAQILSYALTVALALTIDGLTPGLALFVFLLFRELLAAALWRLILHGANEDDAPLKSPRWRAALDADSYFSRAKRQGRGAKA